MGLAEMPGVLKPDLSVDFFKANWVFSRQVQTSPAGAGGGAATSSAWP